MCPLRVEQYKRSLNEILFWLILAQKKIITMISITLTQKIRAKSLHNTVNLGNVTLA